MVRTSQCFRAEFFQYDGPRTLAAAQLFPYTLVPSTAFFASHCIASLLDFSFKEKWHLFLVSFSLRCMFFLKSLRGFGRQLFEAARQSKFQAHTQGRKSAALSMTAA